MVEQTWESLQKPVNLPPPQWFIDYDYGSYHYHKGPFLSADKAWECIANLDMGYSICQNVILSLCTYDIHTELRTLIGIQNFVEDFGTKIGIKDYPDGNGEGAL